MHGTIHSLHPARGFGFIRDTEGAEVFVHRRAVTFPEGFATLAVGIPVACEPESGPKGLRTAKLTLTPVKNLPCGRLQSWQPIATDTRPAKSMT